MAVHCCRSKNEQNLHTRLYLFVTGFVVDIAAAIGGLNPDESYVVLGATILAAAAIVAGGVGFALPEEQA